MNLFSKKILIPISIAIILSAGFFAWHAIRQEIYKETGFSKKTVSPIELPGEIVLNEEETIPLTWTDDNTNENLIIQSDRQYYSGNNSSEVFFGITNATGLDQKPNIKFIFDKEEGRGVREIALLNTKNDIIPSGQTNFYRAIIFYPQNSNGEFFIEAKSDQGGYGYLDPYYASGLVGYWSFNGADIDNSKNLAYDRSGSSPANNGTITNMATSSRAATGISGQALSFDGVNDEVVLDGYTDFDMSLENAFTISAWVYPKTITGNTFHAVFARGGINTGYSNQVYNLTQYNNRWYSHISDGTNPILTDAAVVEANKWQYVTWKWDGTTLSLYKNASLVDSEQNASFTGLWDGNEASDRYTSIGAEGQNVSEYFDGLIDEVRIYNRALSPTEITELYNIGAARLKVNTPIAGYGAQSGLVGHWTLDGQDTNWTSATAGTTADKSGNNNTGTMTNMSRSSSPKPGISGQALKFDGVDDYVQLPSSMPSLGDFTVSGWMKANSFPALNASLWGVNGNNRLMIRDTSEYMVLNGFTLFNVTTPSNLNTWVFVTVTRQGTTATYYRNAASVSSWDVGSNAVNFSSTFLGTDSAGDFGSSNHGLIDEVRVYNRALSPSEIQELYKIGASRMQTNSQASAPFGNSGLVGYWTFDGQDTNWTSNSTGTTADKSGNNNTGTLTNMSRSSSPKPGISGQALSFDGVNDRVQCGTDSSLDLTGNLTVSAWIYPNTTKQYQGIASRHDGGFVLQTPERGYILYLRIISGNWWWYWNVSGDTSSFGNAYNSGLPQSGWYHVVGVTNGTSHKLYLNGIEKLSGTVDTGDRTISSTFKIGDDYNGSEDFQGLIDEVRVYSRALSESEIQQLYQLGSRKVKF